MTAALNAAVLFWAAELNIPQALLFAIVEVESTNNECAIRYEPGYRWLWNATTNRAHRGEGPPPSPVRGMTDATELWSQQASWGPMQIMGATARELGFRDWPSKLCGEPGVEYGAKYLRRKYDRYHSWEKAIEAYNAGRPNTRSGERYRRKVVKHWRRLSGEVEA